MFMCMFIFMFTHICLDMFTHMCELMFTLMFTLMLNNDKKILKDVLHRNLLHTFVLVTLCLAPILRRIKNDPIIPNLERKDNGLRTCIEKGDLEQSKRVQVKRKWGKSVTYADDATIVTKLNKETIKGIINNATTTKQMLRPQNKENSNR